MVLVSNPQISFRYNRKDELECLSRELGYGHVSVLLVEACDLLLERRRMDLEDDFRIQQEFKLFVKKVFIDEFVDKKQL